MRNRLSFRVAFCGVLAALMIAVMLLGTMIPTTTYICPALAGVLLLPVVWEFGFRTGALLYLAVALLSLILSPNKEAALFFVLLFGWYPLLRPKLQHLRRKPWRIILKLLLFNLALAVIFALLLFVFVMPDLQAEAQTWTGLVLAGMFLLGNVTFCCTTFCWDGSVTCTFTVCVPNFSHTIFPEKETMRYFSNETETENFFPLPACGLGFFAGRAGLRSG
ncbi:MAG: hypothetical protein ACLUV1_08340 [Evtepia gabavorous]|uniref:hypothetical protein n=1 Tax=Evtepia gabavorous TaxID=2211183 RepID=UPI003999BAD0